MRLVHFFISLLCTTGITLAAQPAIGKQNGAIDLDDARYRELTSSSRDYYLAVILTALDSRFHCALCRELEPEWELIAHSWNKGSKPDGIKVVFGTLDFNNGKETFQSYMLQTAPVIFLFPPTVGPFSKGDRSPARLELSSPSAEKLYAWINRHLPEGDKPPLVRPINYIGLISVITILLGAITVVTVAAPYVLPIIQNRNLWAAVSLIAILLFTSGQMFNHIRKVPYVANNGRGGISYFAGGYSNQFGLETQIIAAIYGLLSFAIISLALKAPRIVDTKAQQIAVVAWGLVLLGAYSFLMSTFRIKNGGYPFFLPPF